MGAAKATNGVEVSGFAGSVVPSTLAPGGTGLYGSGPSYGLFGLSNSGTGASGQTGDVCGVLGQASGTGWGFRGRRSRNQARAFKIAR